MKLRLRDLNLAQLKAFYNAACESQTIAAGKLAPNEGSKAYQRTTRVVSKLARQLQKLKQKESDDAGDAFESDITRD